MTYNQWLKKVDEEMYNKYGNSLSRHNIRPYDYKMAFYDEEMTPEEAVEDAMEANQCAMLWEIDIECAYLD